MVSRSDSPLDLRVSRAESVASQLETEIMDGAIGPGDRIGTKEELRKRFGVAVATVNEAVRLLETRGLVEARPGPGGGIFATSGSLRLALSHSTLRFKGGGSSFADLLAVRDALEPLICREAARNHSREDIAACHRLLDQMEARLADPRAYLHLNYKLHRRIAKLCANAPLHRIYLMLLDSMEADLDRAELSDFEGRPHLEEHRELVAAIEEGDNARLEVAIARQSPSYLGPR
ncbi:MAG TPA: FCD domain-containing protein [Solirubrobacterales bacterium]